MKQRRVGYTFHPKIYAFEWPDRAEILIGSNNLTEGGFYTNYEGAVLVTYEFPRDRESYAIAQADLRVFLDPQAPTVRPLSEELIQTLVQQRTVRAEREVRKSRRQSDARRARGESPFGEDHVPDPPPLPKELFEELITVVNRERRSQRRRHGRKAVQSSVEIGPTAFYMHLNKLQGANIPGEARIPREARDLAEEFWGWPSFYRTEYRTRGKKKRRYDNWKPVWRIFDSADPATIYFDEVRMYDYAESADFRFYSSRLVDLGADDGDIVRITRVSEPTAEFECILAQHGAPEHPNWDSYCTRQIRNSTRRFGYA